MTVVATAEAALPPPPPPPSLTKAQPTQQGTQQLHIAHCAIYLANPNTRFYLGQ